MAKGRRKRQEEAKTLEELLAVVQKQGGKKKLAIASEVEEIYKVKHLPTGIKSIDDILGGGLPQGLITEAYGPWSGGKTFLAMYAVATTQSNGGNAAWIDTEATFAPAFARAVGIDMDRLAISTPECGEDALDTILALVKSEAVSIIVLDSATSITPRDIIAKEVEIDGYPAGVRLWNAGLIRLKPILFGRPISFLFTNQVRENVGVMYGPQTTEPMGWRSKHDSALRLEVRRREWIKSGDQKIGQVSVVKVAKSKVDGVQPYTETTFDIPFKALVDQGRQYLAKGIEPTADY